MELIFEWDSKKAEGNFKKHSVSFEEISTVFYDPDALEMTDKKHSLFEKRTVLLGFSVAKRLLTIVFTIRKNNVRIITARLASRKERNHYEKNNF